MTASTSSRAEAASYTVPGVYGATRPRVPAARPERTDVAGFIGFEPRVRDADPPSRLTGGTPPTGHDFAVDVNACQLRRPGWRVSIPATPRLVLSRDPARVPLADGQTVIYTIAVSERKGRGMLTVVPGLPANTGREIAASDQAVAAAVADAMEAAGDTPEAAAARPWVRLADVSLRRAGAVVRLTVLPALRVTRCDDWNDYLAVFGPPRDDGTLLGRAVQVFFANGGGRCYVSTVRRPDFDDAFELGRANQDLTGVPGASQAEATGLERLLLVDEVSVVDAPDLYARGGSPTTRTVGLPPPAPDACFQPCPLPPAPVVQIVAGEGEDAPPLFPADLFAADPWSDPFLGAQLRMITRCVPERWRAVLLLAPPLTLDGGDYVPPDAPAARRWCGVFDAQQKTAGLGERGALSCAALYFPWLLTQETVGGPVRSMPPTPAAAGVLARRDLARGPQIAPANETLRATVGTTRPIDDPVNSRLYSPEPDANGDATPAVNLVRPFAGYGIQVWGARTLSTDPWLRFLNVRRALSAIERRCRAMLETLVFEANTPFLWLQITQSVIGVLMPFFDSGALRGTRPAEAFYVRCDSTNNPSEAIAAGQLLCEVGVAITAPAEFIVFRVGRSEGVVEVLE